MSVETHGFRSIQAQYLIVFILKKGESKSKKCYNSFIVKIITLLYKDTQVQYIKKYKTVCKMQLITLQHDKGKHIQQTLVNPDVR